MSNFEWKTSHRKRISELLKEGHSWQSISNVLTREFRTIITKGMIAGQITRHKLSAGIVADRKILARW